MVNDSSSPESLGGSMTVCVAVRVNDSMVFAADSASTLEARKPSGESVIVNVYRHGDKIFNLYKGLPVVAMTCGMGHIGDRHQLPCQRPAKAIGGRWSWMADTSAILYR